MRMPEDKQECPCLAMTKRQAAASLGISERLLQDLTRRGDIPCVRIGERVKYPVDALRDWLRNQPRAFPATET